jgi:hypothetical protein
VHTNTAVATCAGVQAWTDYDPTTRLWHVVVRRDGKLSTPPSPAAAKPFEVDVGPGPNGPPMLAYTTCTTTCRVTVSALDGSGSRTVPGSQGASHPAIWGARVAWVRGSATVMTSLADRCGRKVVGGVSHTKCHRALTGHGLACAPPRVAAVGALALYGRRLALIDTFDLNDGIGADGTGGPRIASSC